MGLIHLCFGASVAGCLRHAFRKTADRVIGFPVDFSVGPIADLDKDPGISRHFDWQRETLHPVFGDLADDEPDFREALRELRAIKPETPVTIWTGDNASEQVGLRMVLHLMRDKGLSFEEVNTSRAMDGWNEGRDIRVDIRHSGECSPEQLMGFYQKDRTEIPAETVAQLAEEGALLLQSESLVRSWRDGRIMDEPETRDDEFIMKHARKLRPHGFLTAARLVGEVIGHTEQPLSDLWIESRIRALIKEGRIDFKGDLGSMRLYRVRAK